MQNSFLKASNHLGSWGLTEVTCQPSLWAQKPGLALLEWGPGWSQPVWRLYWWPHSAFVLDSKVSVTRSFSEPSQSSQAHHRNTACCKTCPRKDPGSFLFFKVLVMIQVLNLVGTHSNQSWYKDHVKDKTCQLKQMRKEILSKLLLSDYSRASTKYNYR